MYRKARTRPLSYGSSIDYPLDLDLSANCVIVDENLYTYEAVSDAEDELRPPGGLQPRPVVGVAVEDRRQVGQLEVALLQNTQ